jgi:general secretion pathway protein G
MPHADHPLPDAHNHRKTDKSLGFTLTELLVVMVILSLLAAAITPQVMGRLDKSKVRAARLQMDTLSASLDLFKLDTGRYPTEVEGLTALMEAPAGTDAWDGPYVRSNRSIIDPWQRPYLYKPDGRTYRIVTLGADGAEGGEGYDRDLAFPELTTAGS